MYPPRRQTRSRRSTHPEPRADAPNITSLLLPHRVGLAVACHFRRANQHNKTGTITEIDMRPAICVNLSRTVRPEVRATTCYCNIPSCLLAFPGCRPQRRARIGSMNSCRRSLLRSQQHMLESGFRIHEVYRSDTPACKRRQPCLWFLVEYRAIRAATFPPRPFCPLSRAHLPGLPASNQGESCSSRLFELEGAQA